MSKSKKIKYPAYQCFKTLGRDVYCSATPVKNHDIGSAWVGAAIEHFNLQGNDIHGKPFLSNDPPRDAIFYPED